MLLNGMELLSIICVWKRQGQQHKQEITYLTHNTHVAYGVFGSPPVVREFEIVGSDVYVCGSFSGVGLQEEAEVLNIGKYSTELGWRPLGLGGLNGACYAVAFHAPSNLLFVGG